MIINTLRAMRGGVSGFRGGGRGKGVKYGRFSLNTLIHTSTYILYAIIILRRGVEGVGQRREGPGSGWWGLRTPYCFRPRVEAPPRIRLAPGASRALCASPSNRMYIARTHTHRGIVRSNNFNGSRERISFVRRRE